MLLSFARKIALCCGLLVGIPGVVSGQTNYYAANGFEYAMAGSLPGDQVFPDAAVTPAGGFVVWQDNITDGDGLGISMMPVNGTLSGSGGIHHVNVQGAGDQQNPRVTLLQGGGAAFVWQGGPKESQRIYARFLSSSNTWLTSDVPVNTFTNNFQINPAVATLTNGNVVVVWSSLNEAGPGSMQDVYGRIFSPTGQPITGEFPINQYVNFNQRTPTVAALSNGGFVVAWVSEQQRVVAALSPGLITPGQVQNASIDIYARLYNGSGVAQGNEFVASSADSNPCANPDVAAGSGGGFMVTWDAFDMASPTTNSLDIYARSFTSAGAGSGGTVVRVNTHLYGDQYAPRISALGTDYLIVWTSLAQDGSREGVYGQFLHGDGSKVGGEFRVNTTTVGSQIQPVVVSDGSSQFLAIWSSFTGLQYGFDLYAQRYVNTQQPLEPMAAPFVYAPFTLSNGVYQPQLVVSWPALSGLSISTYEVYVDGAGTPTAATTSNVWTMTAADGLTTSATHSFQVNYVTTDGRSPSSKSPSASGTTWIGNNYHGIPVEWMAEYYGYGNPWPADVNAPLVPGGPTLLQVFLSGGNPLDPGTWLNTQLLNTPQGLFLTWNPQPGLTYQVKVKTNLTASSWGDFGVPRFAAGTNDSIYVGGSPAGYYQVWLVR